MANRAGIIACGASAVEELTAEAQQLKEWLGKGMHGEMGYMENYFEKRTNPALLVDGAKSVISVIEPYSPENEVLWTVPPKISRYALVPDYHTELRKKLIKLLNFLKEKNSKIEGRAFVDSAPVLEKAWATRAGLGWIGKNGLLINQRYGSYIFIGQLIVNATVDGTWIPATNRCGNCSRCFKACPTNAIVSPGLLDARLCISYLTIEKKGFLNPSEQKVLHGWCFGCDTCQEVCPWNNKKGRKQTSLPLQIDLKNLLKAAKEGTISPTQWEKTVKGTPFERITLERMRMNLLID